MGLSGRARGDVEAGNEADGETGLDGLQESCDWVYLWGGVGGVDIHVGAANKTRSDSCELGGVSSRGLLSFFVGVVSWHEPAADST